MTDSFRYWAFISYSRKDAEWAKWLHKALEHYVVPKRLVGTESRAGTVPRRVFPVFKDTEELAGASSLPESLQQALHESRSLIVICSAHGALSKWVDLEVRVFKQLGRSGHVFALLVDGEPGASDNPASEMPEALPPSLRFGVDAEGELTTERTEPLAVDLRDHKAHRHAALLRLVAGIIGVGYDALVLRDRQARRWRMVQASAVVCAIVAAGAVLWWQQHDEAVLQERIASLRQLEQSARRLVASDSPELNAGVLLATEAVHRAVALHQPSAEALQSVRNGMALLPSRVPLLLDGFVSAMTWRTFSPDGKWISARDGDRLLVWETKSGKLIAKMGPIPDFLRLGFSSGAPRIAFLDAKGIEVWDVSSGKRISQQPIPGVVAALAQQEGVVELSDDGRQVAYSVPESREIHIWDITTGQVTQRLDLPVQIAIAVEFSVDGEQLITLEGHASNSGQAEAVLRVWDIASGRETVAVPHQTFIDSAASALDTPLVASLTDGLVRLVDGSGKLTTRTIEVPAGPAFAPSSQNRGTLALSRGGRWVAVSNGSSIHIWHVPSARLVARIAGSQVVGQFSPNGRFLLDGNGAVWQMNSDAQLNALMDEQLNPMGMLMAANAPVLAHGSLAGKVTVLDLAAADILASIDEGPMCRVVAIDDKGKQILVMSGTSIGAQSSARVWDARTGRKLATLDLDGQIWLSAFAPDGKTLWLTFQSADGQDQAVSFDTASFRKRLQFRVSDVQSLGFSADGRELVVHGKGPSKRYDATTGGALPSGSAPSPSSEAAQGVGPADDWTLETGGGTGPKALTVRHVASDRRWPLAQNVEASERSRDGSRIAVLSTDGHLRVHWIKPPRVIEEACRRLGRELTAEERERHLHERTGAPACRPLALGP